jgi:hypothetical protein
VRSTPEAFRSIDWLGVMIATVPNSCRPAVERTAVNTVRSELQRRLAPKAQEALLVWLVDEPVPPHREPSKGPTAAPPRQQTGTQAA